MEYPPNDKFDIKDEKMVILDPRSIWLTQKEIIGEAVLDRVSFENKKYSREVVVSDKLFFHQVIQTNKALFTRKFDGQIGILPYQSDLSRKSINFMWQLKN